MENPYVPEFVKIKKVTSLTADMKSFVLDKKMKFEPGQFVEISVLNMGEAPFCMSNYSEKEIELTVRDVGNVSNSMHRLKAGDKVGIRGPYGHGYPMKEISENNILLVAGGSGLVPIKSVLEYIQQHRADYLDIRMFLGFRSPQDILFREKILEWHKQFDVKLAVDKGDEHWVGEIGNPASLLMKYAPQNKDSVAVLCGPPIMIKFTIESLKKLGWNDDQIYVSMERLMHCGIGKCGHCMIGGKYVCKDGPVFRYDVASWLSDG